MIWSFDLSGSLVFLLLKLILILLCDLCFDFVGFWAIHLIHLVKQVHGSIGIIPLLLWCVASATTALGALLVGSAQKPPLIRRIHHVVSISGYGRLVEGLEVMHVHVPQVHERVVLISLAIVFGLIWRLFSIFVLACLATAASCLITSNVLLYASVIGYGASHLPLHLKVIFHLFTK